MLNVKEQIKQEYQSRLRSGEKVRGLLTKLAKKYGVSRSTVSSWKKRDEDDWDDLSNASHRTVATESETDASRNWSKLKTEYLIGDYSSLEDFAIHKGIPVSGHFWNMVKGWSEERRAYQEEKSRKTVEKTIEKTAEKASDDISDFAVHTARTLLDAYEENQAVERKLIAKLYQKADQIIEEIDLKQVVIKRKKKAKVEAQIPATLRLGDVEIMSTGDFEFIQEEVETDIDIVKGIADHTKFESAVRGLERIQNMNRIAFGIDRLEKKEDRREELELKHDLRQSIITKQEEKDGSDPMKSGEIIVRFVDSESDY